MGLKLKPTNQTAVLSRCTKSMWVICIDCEGTVHQDEVPPGQIINQHYYLEVLQCVREEVSQKNTHIDGRAGLVASP
jgi:hypothetical protein